MLFLCLNQPQEVPTDKGYFLRHFLHPFSENRKQKVQDGWVWSTGKGLVHMKIIRSIFSITDMKKALQAHGRCEICLRGRSSSGNFVKKLPGESSYIIQGFQNLFPRATSQVAAKRTFMTIENLFSIVWRLPRGSNTPLLCSAASLIPRCLQRGL